MSEDFFDGDKSAFNMGIATLKRIDLLLDKCRSYRESNDFSNWFRTLKSIKMELHPFAYRDKDYKEKVLDLEDSCNNLINVYETNHNLSNKKKLGVTLELLELNSRNKLFDHDLLMLTKGDPSRALLGG